VEGRRRVVAVDAVMPLNENGWWIVAGGAGCAAWLIWRVL
jgi:hypothetical protein